jgi:2-hydroxychromene-2-carboxylate isomerase
MSSEPGKSEKNRDVPTIEFWFDFVSAYSWLGCVRAIDLAKTRDVRLELHPFVLGAALETLGRKAVAQVAASRPYAVFDVAREAKRLGRTFVGPPEHPFASLAALRTVLAFPTTDGNLSLQLTLELFEACWERGLDLTDRDVLIAAVRAAGLDTPSNEDDFAARIRDSAIKQRLRSSTDEAVTRGVFGAPFFFLGGEPFYGQDRLDQLLERLDGAPGLPADVLAFVERSAGAAIPGRQVEAPSPASPPQP